MLWTSQQGSSSDDNGYGVAVDKSGNFFVTGRASGSINGQPYAGGEMDIILLEYSSDGVVLTTRMTGTTGDDQGRGVTVVSGGAAYITGYTNGSLNGNTYQVVIRLLFPQKAQRKYHLLNRLCIHLFHTVQLL